MNYPHWIVPYLGGAWVIGIMAIIHMFLSHFAVGGGAYFALTEQIAYKNKDQRLYKYLKSHSKFFILLTTVAGAVTGVGIWWTISLVSPDGTGALIQNYTLCWALEYLFFAAELATVFAYYYTWDKVSPETHLKIARFYFGLSVFTLVVINGILTFMLTPGNWVETRNWADGFFNQTYWPSLVLRLFIMFGIAGMYALVTSARIKEEDLRTRMLQYSAKWLLPLFFFGPIIGLWYFSNLPQVTIETIFNGIQASGVGNFSILARALYISLILSGTIVIFAYVGPYLNPKGFSVNMAILFLICGLTVTGMTEWTRELLRKPYVVYNYMYSNGILKEDVAELNRVGVSSRHKWLPADHADLTPVQRGELMFRAQCMSCHTTNGYRSMTKLIGERDLAGIESFLTLLQNTDPAKNPYAGIMPPLAGTQQEVQDLAAYLNTLNPKKPEGSALSYRGNPETVR